MVTCVHIGRWRNTFPLEQILQYQLPIESSNTLTPAETVFLKQLEASLKKNEWFTNSEARAITEKTEGSVKRFLRNLTDKGILETRGENKTRQYRLRQVNWYN